MTSFVAPAPGGAAEAAAESAVASSPLLPSLQPSAAKAAVIPTIASPLNRSAALPLSLVISIRISRVSPFARRQSTERRWRLRLNNDSAWLKTTYGLGTGVGLALLLAAFDPRHADLRARPDRGGDLPWIARGVCHRPSRR